ncbi:MAG: MBL fold metallo-hydrolase [Phycisphaerae bacterium]|nr:MBL fold metallo-hydrolase [Phycisphaerae bacterium]
MKTSKKKASTELARRDILKLSGLALGGLAMGDRTGNKARAATGDPTQQYSYYDALDTFSVDTPLGPDEMRITFLGSTIPPTARRVQQMMSVFVEVGSAKGKGDSFVFDCGSGVVANYGALGIPFSKMNKVFITHLHGDHMSDLCHIYCFGPSQDRKSPLYVFSHGNSTVANPTGSPEAYDDGVVAYCENLRKAMRWHTESFSFLSTGYQSYTRPTRESWGLPADPVPVGDDDPSDGYALIPIELDWTRRGDVEGDNVAYHNPESGVKITHFPVIHCRKGSIGFKLEWNGLSMIYTGDTKPETNFLHQVNNHKDASGNPKAIDVAIHEMIVPAEVWAMKTMGYTEPGGDDDPAWRVAYNTAVAVQNSSHTPQGAFGYLLSQMPLRPRLAVATHFPVADDTVASALASVQAHCPDVQQGRDITWSFDRMVIRVTASEITQLRANVPDFTFGAVPAETHADVNTPKYHNDENKSDPYAQLDRSTEILSTEEGGKETYREDGY